MKKICEKCKFRAVYDRDNSSFMGRLWRWHINFCPGWKLYFNSLSETEQQQIKSQYNYKR